MSIKRLCHMKYLIVMFIFVLFFGKISGQTQNYFTNDTLDQIIRYGLCYEDDHYFLTHVGEWSIPSGSLLYGTEGYDCYLIRLDSSLKMIDSLLFEPMDGFLLNITKVVILDDTIFAVGRAIKPDNSDEQVFFGRYTLDFQFIDYSFFGDTTQIEIMSDFILNDKENLVISAKVTSVDFEVLPCWIRLANKEFMKENFSVLPIFMVKFAFRFIFNPLIKYSDEIIVHEKLFKKRILEQYYRKSADNIHVVHHGIEDFSKQKLTKQKARKEVSIWVKEKVILFMWYITGYKGIDLLVEWMSEYKKNFWDDFKLVVLGAHHPKLKDDQWYKTEYNRLKNKAVK